MEKVKLKLVSNVDDYIKLLQKLRETINEVNNFTIEIDTIVEDPES